MDREKQIELAKEFNKLITDWIASKGMTCDKCKNKTDKTKDGCKLKVYCIVKDKHGFIGYDPVETE